MVLDRIKYPGESLNTGKNIVVFRANTYVSDYYLYGHAVTDPTTYETAKVITSPPAVSDPGLVVRNIFPMAEGKSIGISGNIGITTAAEWDQQAMWAVPSGYWFKHKVARCGVTTAGSRTLIMAAKKLATFNPNTNTFASISSVSAPDFYDRLFYRIETTHSATATTVTATYADQDGNSSTTSGNIIPSAAAANNWYEFVLADGDYGVRSITNCSDTAAPSSVVDEIWGCRTLLEDLGAANSPHIEQFGEGFGIRNGESIIILFNAAAATAQQRFAQVMGDLVTA